MLVVFIYVPQNSGLAKYNNIIRIKYPNATFEEVRAERIPQYTEEGGRGWTGSDLWADYRVANPETPLVVEYSVPWPEQPEPRLCLLKPQERAWQELGENPTIAIPTKYANLAFEYMQGRSLQASPRFFAGKVEEQIRRGTADAAIDIVCTGSTMRKLGLSVEDIVFGDPGLVLLKSTEVYK